VLHFCFCNLYVYHLCAN